MSFERSVGPNLTVKLDETANIVLVSRDERTFVRTQVTVSNVDALKAALDDARTFQAVITNPFN